MAKCKWCSTTIEPKAWVCPTCKHYQTWWWVNAVFYLGGLVAVAGAVVSIWLFAANQWHAFEASSYGTVDLELIEARNEDVSLRNKGERDIFVSGIILECPQQKDYFPINQIIRAGALESFQNKFAILREWRCIIGDDAKPVKDRTATVKNQAYRWFSVGHPQLSAHFNLEKTHAILDGTARLIYRPFGSSEPLEEEFDCKVLIVQVADKNGEFSFELGPPDPNLVDPNWVEQVREKLRSIPSPPPKPIESPEIRE